MENQLEKKKEREILIKRIYGVCVDIKKIKNTLPFKKPPKPITAYNYFIKEKRSEFAKLLINMNSKEVNSFMGRYWKTLSYEERKVYSIMSYFDEVRYYNELINLKNKGYDMGDLIIREPKNYQLFTNAITEDQKYKIAEMSIKKSRNYAVTKARTPYILYMKEQSENIKSKYPHIKFIEISNIISESWNNITTMEKEKYIKMSEKERKYYIAKKEELINN